MCLAMVPNLSILAIVLLGVGREATSASDTCKGPETLEAQVRAHPSAGAWGALGGWFGERHEFSCAIPAFESALRLDPASARMHYFLGLSLYSAGRVDASIGELRRSVELDPKDVQAFLALGVAFHQLGRTADAEATWEDALAIDPNSTTALDWLAKARIADGQFGAAIELLSSAPPDENLTLDLALAYSQSGAFDKAADTLNAALAKSPGALQVGTALATVYVQSHRYQDATNLIRGILNVHPKDAATQLLYLRLLVLQDDDADAEPIVEKMLAEYPQNFDALYLAGVVENDEGQYAMAVEHLQAAARLNPNHYDVRFNLGTAFAHLKQNEAAREQLEKAVALDPAKAEAHFHLAQLLRTLGQTAEAQLQLKLFEQCQQATTTLALGQTKAGQAAQELDAGNAAHAILLYREAIDALPRDAVLEYDLALALDRAGDAAAERAALEKALQLRPGFAEAENQLGLVTARAGESSAAEQHFRNAIAAAPSYAEAANNLGTLLGQQGRDREAEAFLRAAVSANPRFGQAWVNLAATLASESRFPEARVAVESALRINPQNADALRLRAMLADAASGEPGSSSAKSASTRKPH
jgi:tetratricopeptide (TPR) repeat protein